jgi:hypothetical protein
LHDKTQTQTQPQPNLTYPPKIGDRRNLLVGRCDENTLHRLSVEETVATCHAKSHCKMKMKNTKTILNNDNYWDRGLSRLQRPDKVNQMKYDSKSIYTHNYHSVEVMSYAPDQSGIY